ncbi:MAG: hypothetical protein R6X20_01200 [Phycisphaerae bacterium]
MTSPLPPDPANWTTRRVGKDEELQCDRCMQRMRPGGTAYVADHTDDEFPHVAVYCSVACRHFAERPLATYLSIRTPSGRDDGAALAAARARADADHVDLASAYDDVTVLHEDLPVVRGKIADLRAKAEDAHPDMAEVYRKDADDLQAIVDLCGARDFVTAARCVDALDTAVRDILGQRLYDTIHAQAAIQEPVGIDEQDLFDALKDNLSPQAVAAIVAYLQPANTSNPEVNRQLRWLADRLTDLVGGPDQLDRLTDELGL